MEARFLSMALRFLCAAVSPLILAVTGLFNSARCFRLCDTAACNRPANSQSVNIYLMYLPGKAASPATCWGEINENPSAANSELDCQGENAPSVLKGFILRHGAVSQAALLCVELALAVCC